MYKDILLTVDLAHLDDEMRAVGFAVEYAQTFGSTLHILTVVPDFGLSIVGSFFPPDHEKTSTAKASEALLAFTRRVIPAGIRLPLTPLDPGMHERVRLAMRQAGVDV